MRNGEQRAQHLQPEAQIKIFSVLFYFILLFRLCLSTTGEFLTVQMHNRTIRLLRLVCLISYRILHCFYAHTYGKRRGKEFKRGFRRFVILNKIV